MITFIIWAAVTAFLGYLTVKYVNPWAMRRRIRKQERVWEREADMEAWKQRTKRDRRRSHGSL